MDAKQLFSEMDANADRIRHLSEGVSVEQARWRPDPVSWSLLEVIAHLYDEEREDFRVRMEIMLQRPDEGWPPIDPQGWVKERDYNSWNLQETLDGYRRERAASLTWLRQIESADWDKLYEAPFGPMRAGDMLAAWAAHDLLHLRQLVELHHAWIGRVTMPYDTRYAGEW